PDGFPCQEDGDCALAEDCCGCYAYNPMFGSPGNCGGQCEQQKCAEWGLTAAACEQGVCVVKAKSCNQDKVLCDALPPECKEGTLPQVDGGCWTGACLPIEACDWVPDCSHCPPGDTCKTTQGEGDSCVQHECIPPFPECFGEQNCACLGPVFCPQEFPSCVDGDGGIVCS
ncbi:MAG: hypothetical protein KC636_38645, partial [Myxococcales bacterium]|nr:hypothetical protein [Myxococcales bacterium]